jgi:predicted site-specific integrase-resolvase
MSIVIDGKEYYKTGEACKLAGISRATLFRWLKNNIYQDVSNKDRRGWRLFTDEDIERLRMEANKITISPSQLKINFNKKR